MTVSTFTMLRSTILCGLLCGLCFSGCALFQKQDDIHIEEVPPHYASNLDSPTESAKSYPNQTAGFHDPRKDPTVNNPRFVKNKQMLALEREIDEEKLDKAWEEDYEATMARREKMQFWKDWSWFQSGDSTTGMSSEAKSISERLERQ